MKLEQSLQTALQYIDSGDLHSAEKLLNQLQATKRNHPGVLFLGGCIEHTKSNYESAISAFKKVLRVDPLYRNARLMLGVALVSADHAEEAVTHLSRVLIVDPSNAYAYYTQANAYLKCGQLLAAKQAYLKCVAIDSHNHSAYNNLGVTCKAGGEYTEAIKYFRKAIEIAPSIEYYTNLLTLVSLENSPQEYTDALEVLKLKDPGNALPMIYTIFQRNCRWDLVESMQDKAIEFASSGAVSIGTLQQFLLTSNYLTDISPVQLFALHRSWGERIERHDNRRIGDHYTMPVDGKLRIGYLSGDLYRHPVGYFINNIISTHDRERFEIYCYSTFDVRDDFSNHIKNSAHSFFDVAAMTDYERARKIFDDGIHILVDLAGNTTHTGVVALKYRPAPVQITYLGYPNTTGLAAVDFRITDHYAESPVGTLYTEELLRLPESFLCFGAFVERPIHHAPPSDDKGYVTFSSFNDLRKLSSAVIRVWSEILTRVPGSRMMIKAKRLSWVHVRENIIAEFAKRGIEEDRLILHGGTSDLESHLDMYNTVDIALDTFPYNGATTTCEALWMAVPVVTLVGNLHVQRVAYTLLKNIGIEDTIAHSEQDYIDVAVNLATDTTRLQDLRARLPAAIRGSILCDPARFTLQLEALYCEAWKRKGYELPF